MFGIFKITSNYGKKNETAVRMTKDGRELSFATHKIAKDRLSEIQRRPVSYDDAILVVKKI